MSFRLVKSNDPPGYEVQMISSGGNDNPTVYQNRIELFGEYFTISERVRDDSHLLDALRPWENFDAGRGDAASVDGTLYDRARERAILLAKGIENVVDETERGKQPELKFDGK